MKEPLENILLLDIETVSVAPTFDGLSAEWQQEWIRKADRIVNQNEQLTPEQTYAKHAAIYAEFGKIITIGVGKYFISDNGQIGIRIRSFSGHDEHKVLKDFLLMLLKNQNFKRLCGHNIREFDIPYLCRRLLVNNLQLPPLLNIGGRKPYELDYLLDTLHLWKFGDYKHYTSLNLLTSLFNIPSAKEDMDGSKVGECYWKENNLEKISTYCKRDVLAVAQLYLKIKGYELAKDEAIEFV